MGAKDALAHLLFAIVGPGDVGGLAQSGISDPPVRRDHVGRARLYAAHAEPGNIPRARWRSLYRDGDAAEISDLVSARPHHHLRGHGEFMKKIVELAAQHGTYIVHDFAYADLGFDGYRPPSILQVEGAKDMAVEIFSMSKSYDMAGSARRLLPGERQADRRARSHQELSGLWRLPSQSRRGLDRRAAENARRKPGRSAQYTSGGATCWWKAFCRAGWPVESPRGTMFLWAPLPNRTYANSDALEFARAADGESTGRPFRRA